METSFIRPLCNAAQRVTLRLFADWKVYGREHVPPMGPLIIVANHQSNMDPPLLGASIPRCIHFLAKDTVFRGPIASWFLRSYGAFPLNRDGIDSRAFRWVLGQLDRGKVVVIFPEGTRSPGAMRKALPGVAHIALRSQAPILPVGITGTERLGTYLRVFNPTGKLTVNIGQTFTVPTVQGRPGRQVLESLTEMIMLRVAALLPESYRGYYSRSSPASQGAADAGKGIEKR